MEWWREKVLMDVTFLTSFSESCWKTAVIMLLCSLNENLGYTARRGGACGSAERLIIAPVFNKG